MVNKTIMQDMMVSPVDLCLDILMKMLENLEVNRSRTLVSVIGSDTKSSSLSQGTSGNLVQLGNPLDSCCHLSNSGFGDMSDLNHF